MGRTSSKARYLIAADENKHMTVETPHLLEKLPKSAQSLWTYLKEKGPETHRGLVQQTYMPPRTVRYALARLRDSGLLDEHPSFNDTRQSYYSARDVPKAEASPKRTTL